MSDQLTAWLRTTVPAAWSTLVAYLVRLGAPEWLTEPLGSASDVLVVPLVLGAVYVLLRAIEPHLPAWLTRLLLGSARQPMYTPHSRSAAE
ncbi:hypothetical protein [Saccharopolyspora shandongensis]|uniref:hypothetical protein n=1 Tax=Saccharopolyspora shandongensis TaxID=418495 RepID=UPI00340AD713